MYRHDSFYAVCKDSIKVCCKLQWKGSVVKSNKVAENLPIQQSPSTIVGLYDGF